MTKVLGISFGTKNGTNDGACKEALMAAADAGCEVEFIRAMDLNIKHCIGCTACVMSLMNGNGNRCIHKDDFDWLFFKMADADGIVITGPIFEKGSCGLFHTIMDRFGPRMDTGMNIMGTKIAEERLAKGDTKAKLPDPRVICPGKPISYISQGGSEWGTRVQADYAIQAMTMGWKIIDNEWIPWSSEALANGKVIEVSHRVGMNIAAAAKDPENAGYQGEKGTCPHCNANEFYHVPGGNRVICTVCGLEGHMELKGDVLSVVYEEKGLYDEKGRFRAHDSVPGKEVHGEDIGRAGAIKGQFMQTDTYKERQAAYKAFISPTMPERS